MLTVQSVLIFHLFDSLSAIVEQRQHKCTSGEGVSHLMITKLQDTVIIYLEILLTTTKRTVWKQARGINPRLKMSQKFVTPLP